jgi:hypothetical protein
MYLKLLNLFKKKNLIYLTDNFKLLKPSINSKILFML